MKYSLKYQPSKIKITDHLTRGEIECHCGCGFGLEDNDFKIHVAQAFEEIRQRVGKPLTASSGCRCIKHNRDIGSEDTSQHPKGLAVDLVCPEDYDFEKFYQICISVIGDGGGVGRYENTKHPFVHIDLRGWKARWNG